MSDDFQKYCDAVGKSAERTRSALVFASIASVIILVHVWNLRPYGWLDNEIELYKDTKAYIELQTSVQKQAITPRSGNPERTIRNTNDGKQPESSKAELKGEIPNLKERAVWIQRVEGYLTLLKDRGQPVPTVAELDEKIHLHL